MFFSNMWGDTDVKGLGFCRQCRARFGAQPGCESCSTSPCLHSSGWVARSTQRLVEAQRHGRNYA